MMWTDDPADDFLRYDLEQEKCVEEYEKRCDFCEGSIRQGFYYIDHKFICPNCINDYIADEYFWDFDIAEQEGLW